MDTLISEMEVEDLEVDRAFKPILTSYVTSSECNMDVDPALI